MGEQAQVEGASVAEDGEHECFYAVHRFLDIPSYGPLTDEMKVDTIVVFRAARDAFQKGQVGDDTVTT